MRQLWRFAARQQNTKLCVYAGRAWARLSCNLQTSVAPAILHRIPTGGHPPAKRTPVEVSVVNVVPRATEAQVQTGPFSSSSCSSLSASSHSYTGQARPGLEIEKAGLVPERKEGQVSSLCSVSSSLLPSPLRRQPITLSTNYDTTETGLRSGLACQALRNRVITEISTFVHVFLC